MDQKCGAQVEEGPAWGHLDGAKASCCSHPVGSPGTSLFQCLSLNAVSVALVQIQAGPSYSMSCQNCEFMARSYTSESCWYISSPTWNLEV